MSTTERHPIYAYHGAATYTFLFQYFTKDVQDLFIVDDYGMRFPEEEEETLKKLAKALRPEPCYAVNIVIGDVFHRSLPPDTPDGEAEYREVTETIEGLRSWTHWNTHSCLYTARYKNVDNAPFFARFGPSVQKHIPLIDSPRWGLRAVTPEMEFDYVKKRALLYRPREESAIDVVRTGKPLIDDPDIYPASGCRRFHLPANISSEKADKEWVILQ